jgi:hypothetical protein
MKLVQEVSHVIFNKSKKCDSSILWARALIERVMTDGLELGLRKRETVDPNQRRFVRITRDCVYFLSTDVIKALLHLGFVVEWKWNKGFDRSTMNTFIHTHEMNEAVFWKFGQFLVNAKLKRVWNGRSLIW